MGTLFEPIKIGTMELKNRIVMPPMGTNFASKDGFVTIPEILGVKGENVVTANDVLAGKASVGERVVVVGGGMVGAETAEFLAEKGKKVTILEMLGRIGIDMVPIVVMLLYQRLRKLGVVMITNAKRKTVEADSVVLAVGSKQNISLVKVLKGKDSELRAIGDAKEPGNVLETIHEGPQLAREI